MKDNLAKYRIKYDTWFHESVLHKGAVDDVIKILTDNGMTYEKTVLSGIKTSKCRQSCLKRRAKRRSR